MKIGELFPVQYDAPRCFACGPDNPEGIRLRFKKESEDRISTRFEPSVHWTGWGDIMHGGFQSLLLDETMAWVAFGLKDVKAFVTKALKVQFLKPVKVGRPLTVYGIFQGDDGKTITATGEIRGPDGELLTSAEAEIVRTDPGRLAAPPPR